MAIQERLGRLDWLGLSWWGLLAGVLYLGLAGLVQVGEAALGHAFLVSVPLRGAGGTVPEGVDLVASPWVPAWIREPTAAQSLLHLATSLPTTCAAIAMLLVLLRIVRNARRGDPFTDANVRLLRLLGVTVLAGGAAADLVEAFAHRALVGPIVDGPVGGFIWSGWWLVGVAFLAIAEVVNRGVRLRVELDGLV